MKECKKLNNIQKVEIINKTLCIGKECEKMKKILILTLAIILNILIIANCVYATNINSANIYATGDCGSLLRYKGVNVIVSYVEYKVNGVSYPAYCLDKTKPGVETSSYTVSVSDSLKDVGLWKRIINGYPYKSIQELGVTNKEEAFTATKQAIYCYIHGNNPDDYTGIGEAGTRTLTAMKKIISDAEKSTETKVSSTLMINKVSSKWEQDKKEKNYVSKIYSVTASAGMNNYKISISKENSKDLGGIKLTDENNKEKQIFSPNEKFKILIPINDMKQDGKISIKAEAQVKTKPVLYGTAPNSEYQDYALTTAMYEDGIGEAKDTYFKNQTKIIIIKQDEKTKAKLENVEFEILNDKMEVVYSNLKTDKDGKIVVENVVPGTYYIKEVKTLDGYIKFAESLKIDTNLNQEATITFNNSREEIPTPEITEKEIEVEPEEQKPTQSKNEKTVETKKLPVTGM